MVKPIYVWEDSHGECKGRLMRMLSSRLLSRSVAEEEQDGLEDWEADVPMKGDSFVLFGTGIGGRPWAC